MVPLRDWSFLVSALLFILATMPGFNGDALAADRHAVTVVLPDALARSNQPARIESRVIEEGLLGNRGVGGERVALSVDGKQVASALTGGDGRAYFEYTPQRLGLHPMKVSLVDSPRVQNAEGTGTLAVWEKRKPLLVIEQAVLIEGEGASMAPGLPFPPSNGLGSPSPGAAEALGRLGKFYYNLIYFVPSSRTGAGSAGEFRAWLNAHGFPGGLVRAVPMTADGLEEALTRLKSEGWDNLRAGVGQSRVFAQVLVAQRLTVAIKSERPRDEFPRKARVVTDWKSVRKHVQE